MHHRSASHSVVRGVFALALVVLSTHVAGCSLVASAATEPRPASWATPVAAGPGLPNLHRVNSVLYRSAQPTKEGFAFLDGRPSLANSDRPIKTVVSLRAFDDDAHLVPPGSTLHLDRIRFKTWHPEDADVIRFLRIVTTPELQPVLVHCQHGADRTGMMVAIYRIAYEGWSKAEATEEMVHGGFGFHPIWRGLVRYIDELDVEAIKQEVAKEGPIPADLQPPPTAAGTEPAPGGES